MKICFWVIITDDSGLSSEVNGQFDVAGNDRKIMVARAAQDIQEALDETATSILRAG